MKIAVLGGDGYCGWATALYLSRQGHSVAIVDNFLRRQWDRDLGVETLTPIRTLAERIEAWKRVTGDTIEVFQGDVTDFGFLSSMFRDFQPEAVVHFAEQRSAPYSMIDRKHAVFTQVEQCAGHAEPVVRDPRVSARLPSGEARHDGRIRHAQYRYRRGLHHHRAQWPQGRAAVSQAAGLLLPSVESARQPQHHVRLPHLGIARHRPQPGRGLRNHDRRSRRSTRR